MWNEPAPLEQMRAELRPQLPERAFLKRDRGDALLITNAPAFGFSPEQLPGCIVETRGMLLCILPDARWVADFEAAIPEPPDHLSRTLMRFRGAEADGDNLRLFARIAKLMDAQPSPGEIEACDRALRNRAALALRGGCGGGLYACACVCALLNRP
ncbi:MAG: hypothetical protein Q4G06_06985 [Clostridia bacterium]|nr:hypothetical protein [Clostridia bacterium]